MVTTPFKYKLQRWGHAFQSPMLFHAVADASQSACVPLLGCFRGIWPLSTARLGYCLVIEIITATPPLRELLPPGFCVAHRWMVPVVLAVVASDPVNCRSKLCPAPAEQNKNRSPRETMA